MNFHWKIMKNDEHGAGDPARDVRQDHRVRTRPAVPGEPLSSAAYETECSNNFQTGARRCVARSHSGWILPPLICDMFILFYYFFVAKPSPLGIRPPDFSNGRSISKFTDFLLLGFSLSGHRLPVIALICDLLPSSTGKQPEILPLQV